ESFTTNHAQGLTTLILTSDIKLDDYQPMLSQPFSVPKLPPSITTLTLELFSLGYPPGFLQALGQALPNLKSLTLYSQLFAGTTQESQDDAVVFIKGAAQLRELHVLDVFAPPGVFKRIAGALAPGLGFLEVCYTYRHSDAAGFLGTLPVKEVGDLVREGLVALTVSIGAPDAGAVEEEDEDDVEGTEVGVRLVGGEEARAVVKRLVGGGKGLIMLDVTMFELRVEEVKALLGACGKLRVLSVAVLLGNGWNAVLEVMKGRLEGVEALEIVGVPGDDFVEKLKAGGVAGLTEEALGKLAEGSKLKSVKTSILRTNGEHWVQRGGSWEKMA
ncbi:hypothetical protein LOCC1_G001758, partial [Lachnellula occidentalis]